MKTMKYLGLLMIVFMIINCTKNDDDVVIVPDTIDMPIPEPEPENQAPGSFDLLEVVDGSTAVDLMPSFSWNTATDPDGDVVGYDLLLGKDENMLNNVVTDLNTATHTVKDRLSLYTEYFWQVTADDHKGKETSSDTYSFITRNLSLPEAESNSADFSSRWLHTVTFFNDRLWLIGGADQDEIKSDIFYSFNGLDWFTDGDEILQPTRGHTTTSFNDTLWVLGGRLKRGANSRTNLMLASTTGNNFVDDFHAPWPAREFHTAVVFKDKVWVLGGVDNNSRALNDVWSTEDVKTWGPDSQETADWGGRYGHSSVVFDDKLWVIGGFRGGAYLNDVWYTDGTTLSSDGTLKWEPVPQENAFPGRFYHQTVVYDNKIWLVGGSGEEGAPLNDIWYSDNGANWVALSQDANFTGRIRPTLTSFENKLLMIGGFDGADFHNDVWVFD